MEPVGAVTRKARGAQGKPLLIGRYVLHDEMASGGMASVYFGQLLGPVGFTRLVAIKRMKPALARDPEFATMFLDEAWLAARVQHPNVVATLDVISEAGELFIVMEYVRGQSLSGLLRAATDAAEPVPAAIAAAVVCQTLAGLHAAHGARGEAGQPLGMIHRDVSPPNVLVGVDGLVKLTDFGVAKAASRLHITRDTGVKGKVAYMAPEQILGTQGLDHRADVFSAGVVLWEALAGRSLFGAETLPMTATRVLNEEAPSVHAFRPDVPPALDAVLRTALAKRPADRFETADQLSAALEDVILPATTRQLGQWVARLARDDLARREAVVGRIEAAQRDRAEVFRELRGTHEDGAKPGGRGRAAPEVPAVSAPATRREAPASRPAEVAPSPARRPADPPAPAPPSAPALPAEFDAPAATTVAQPRPTVRLPSSSKETDDDLPVATTTMDNPFASAPTRLMGPTARAASASPITVRLARRSDEAPRERRPAWPVVGAAVAALAAVASIGAWLALRPPSAQAIDPGNVASPRAQSSASTAVAPTASGQPPSTGAAPSSSPAPSEAAPSSPSTSASATPSAGPSYPATPPDHPPPARPRSKPTSTALERPLLPPTP